MLSRENYIRHSLEINLFFLRLVKEHAILAAASLPPRDINITYQLIGLKNNVEVLLDRAVKLSHGLISDEVLSSGELVTNLTLNAEWKTQFLTGIPINMNITKMELALKPKHKTMKNIDLFHEVSILNRQALSLLNTTIAFKENLLTNILNCRVFSYIYPSMLHHIIEETRLFASILIKLENKEDMDNINESLLMGINWNEIMKEHSQFIRGYLDPSEVKLFETADAFAKEFDKLPSPTSPETIKKDLNAAINLKNFKKQGTEGILDCKIKSLISPLLADHVTREANHYIRLLKSVNK